MSKKFIGLLQENNDQKCLETWPMLFWKSNVPLVAPLYDTFHFPGLVLIGFIDFNANWYGCLSLVSALFHFHIEVVIDWFYFVYLISKLKIVRKKSKYVKKIQSLWLLSFKKDSSIVFIFCVPTVDNWHSKHWTRYNKIYFFTKRMFVVRAQYLQKCSQK